MTPTPTPPHNPDAERSILGAVLIDNQALDRALELLVSSDFFLAPNRIIWDAMVALFTEGHPVDELTLSEALRRANQLGQVGLQLISELARATPTSAHVRAYAKIVADCSTRRRRILAAQAIAAEALRGEEDETTLIARAQGAMDGLVRIQGGGDEHAKAIIVREYQRIERASNLGSSITGLATGYDTLDHSTAGLQPSDLIVLAGATSSGKTAFALNIVANVVLRPNPTPTLIFSMEMSKGQLMSRILGQSARVNLTHLRTGRIAQPDWLSLSMAAGKIAEAPLFIDDTGARTSRDIRTVARRRKRESGLGLVVIDYYQQMAGNNEENRAQELSAISRATKHLAKELDVPVLAISQLNRMSAGRTDKRPKMTDLKESGSIEQDADVIVFLYRDEYYNKDSPDKGIAEVEIAKQRNGPTGTHRLAFLPHLTRFENLADDDAAPGHNTNDNPDERTAQRGAA